MNTQKRKKKRKNSPGMRMNLYFIIFILIIFSIASVIANGIAVLLDKILGLPIELPVAVWVFLFSIVLGVAIAALAGRTFLAPITKLNDAMQAVADGDFTVSMDTKSIIKEIRVSYHNFNKMVQELAATEILQSDFVSNVSHEFKTPINAIEGYAMLLQGDANISEEQEEYIEKILSNTKRLSSLVGNILLLSKLENEGIQAPKELFRLDEHIRRAIVSLEPQWSDKDITFDAEMEQVYYLGNESLLSHVWTNLIGNAIKFSPDHGRIKIKVSRQDDEISVIVQDTGPGIDPEEQKRVFEKFYQSDNSHKGEGNGLGLSLVKRILDINEGTVGVENVEDGIGCRFTVTLPAPDDQ